MSTGEISKMVADMFGVEHVRRAQAGEGMASRMDARLANAMSGVFYSGVRAVLGAYPKGTSVTDFSVMPLTAQPVIIPGRVETELVMFDVEQHGDSQYTGKFISGQPHGSVGVPGGDFVVGFQCDVKASLYITLTFSAKGSMTVFVDSLAVKAPDRGDFFGVTIRADMLPRVTVATQGVVSVYGHFRVSDQREGKLLVQLTEAIPEVFSGGNAFTAFTTVGQAVPSSNAQTLLGPVYWNVPVDVDNSAEAVVLVVKDTWGVFGNTVFIAYDAPVLIVTHVSNRKHLFVKSREANVAAMVRYTGEWTQMALDRRLVAVGAKF
jgi:hypothetical protein